MSGRSASRQPADATARLASGVVVGLAPVGGVLTVSGPACLTAMSDLDLRLAGEAGQSYRCFQVQHQATGDNVATSASALPSGRHVHGRSGAPVPKKSDTMPRTALATLS